MADKQEDVTMGQIWLWIIETFRRQGLSFVLLVAMLWYFQRQNDQLQLQILECNQQRLDYYSNQSIRMMQVIEENTAAINGLMHDRRK